jgi:hypothetical protein
MQRFDSAQRGAEALKAPTALKPHGRRAPRPSDALAQANAALVTNHPTPKATHHGA